MAESHESSRLSSEEGAPAAGAAGVLESPVERTVMVFSERGVLYEATTGVIWGKMSRSGDALSRVEKTSKRTPKCERPGREAEKAGEMTLKQRPEA